jgi:hypothetical protein
MASGCSWLCCWCGKTAAVQPAPASNQGAAAPAIRVKLKSVSSVVSGEKIQSSASSIPPAVKSPGLERRRVHPLSGGTGQPSPTTLATVILPTPLPNPTASPSLIEQIDIPVKP